MKRMLFAAVAVLTAIWAIPEASAQSNTYTVDCNKGQKIATALEQGDFRKPVVINVRGTCREFVTISRENVTLHGDPSAAINAPNSDSDLVTVDADGLTLENLTLTGGYYGVRQEHAFRFMISNCVIEDTRSNGINVFVGDTRFVGGTIQNAGGHGFSLTRGASVTVSNSQIHDNVGSGIFAQRNSTVIVSNGSTISRNRGDGIFLTESSDGSISNSTITQNGANGVFVLAGSHGSLSGNTITANGTNPTGNGRGVFVNMSTAQISGGNVITDNRQAGIHADFSALQIGPSTIANNHESGVNAYFGTAIVLGGATVRDNDWNGFYVSTNSTAQVNESTFKGNGQSGIRLEQASKLQLFGPVMDVTGNGGWGLDCGDNESSVNNTGLLNGSVSPACTGYN